MKRKKDVDECGIEAIAWVEYNNNNLRMSIKQAVRMKCDLDDIWIEMHNISDKYGKRIFKKEPLLFFVY